MIRLRLMSRMIEWQDQPLNVGADVVAHTLDVALKRHTRVPLRKREVLVRDMMDRLAARREFVLRWLKTGD